MTPETKARTVTALKVAAVVTPVVLSLATAYLTGTLGSFDWGKAAQSLATGLLGP